MNKIFDYSFLENGLLPTQITNTAISIGELKEREAVKKRAYPTVFEKLESIAMVASVKNSNAIEGIVTTDERIEAIVNKNSAPLNHDEIEIAGYRDALAYIHENYKTLQINEKEILNLHKIMQLGNNHIIGGEYKKNDNVIASIDSFGHRHIIFKPISADDTSYAMEQLILAYMDANQNYSINQLLLIPCFILDFLSIHPFIDGNGRISRLLSLLLLYKNGFDAGRYISFEEQINQYKADYYLALRESNIGWHENQNNYFPFMGNFTLTLFRCYRELDNRFALIDGKRITKKKRVENAVRHSLAPISKAELANILPDISVNTIADVLGDLVKEGAVKKIGGNRNARYK